MNFKDEMKQKVAQIEIILDEYLPAQEGLQKTVLTAMNTTVKAGGKRLRPMLTRSQCLLKIFKLIPATSASRIVFC